MKVPFGQTLGPLFKQYHHGINTVCKPCVFGSQRYLTVYSLSALAITIFDLFYIIGNGVAPPSMLKSINPRVCPTLLRNSKLIGIGVNICTYILLAIGVLYRYPVFSMLYLGLNFINTLIYILLISVSLVSNWQCTDKKNILLITVMIHNWLQVFCFFRSCLHIGDF